MFTQIERAVQELNQKKPLVLCLSNYVTMDFIANCLLAIGALPLMSEDTREIEELVSLSHAVNLNIGTLNEAFLSRAHAAMQASRIYKKPIVLDPVGAGASHIRTISAQALLSSASIVRGNASEIMALFGISQRTLGVETSQTVADARQAIQSLIEQQDCTIVVSGEKDWVVDKSRSQILPYGSILMKRVTGMGCALTAIITAFQGVFADSFEAASIATAYFGLCGQIAEKKASSPGSFRMHFMDTLYQPDWQAMRMMCAE